MDAMTMRIRITSAMVREKVMKRGMWNITGVPMVVTLWSPEEDNDKKKMLPLWIHLKNVPMSMYSWQGLSFIASAAGVPDRLHPETIACTNFEIAKVFVNADLSKELPQKITYNIQGKETTISFTYPWLPSRCADCGKWGHTKTFCKKKDKEESKQKVETPVRETQSEEDKLSGEVKEGEANSSEKVGVIENEKIEKEAEESKEVESMSEEEGKETEQQNAWKTVSVEKTGRSPKQILKYGQVTIATPSRFAALSNSGENGEEIDPEVIKEIEDEEEEVDELAQTVTAEEVLEDALRDKKRGRARQILPRTSKTNHRVVSEASDHIKDMKRGARKLH